MDGDGIPQAFCALLWRANGGSFSPNGDPVAPRGFAVRGYCTRPYDCYTCELMQEELAFHPPNLVWWVCPDCVSRLKKRTQGIGDHLLLPGFYTEGPCQSPSCQRAPGEFTPLLQLVLGDIRKESG